MIDGYGHREHVRPPALGRLNLLAGYAVAVKDGERAPAGVRPPAELPRERRSAQGGIAQSGEAEDHKNSDILLSGEHR